MKTIRTILWFLLFSLLWLRIGLLLDEPGQPLAFTLVLSGIIAALGTLAVLVLCAQLSRAVAEVHRDARTAQRLRDAARPTARQRRRDSAKVFSDRVAGVVSLPRRQPINDTLGLDSFLNECHQKAANN